MTKQIFNELPKFDNAPVVETVMDIQFQDLVNFKSAYLGDLWSEFGRSEFTTFEDQIPLPKLNSKPGVSFVAQHEIPRAWFLNPSGTILLQFQTDRFCYNWRKKSDGNVANHYPSYDYNFGKFKDYYLKLSDFLGKINHAKPKIELLELKYINVISRSQIGELSNIGKLLHHFKPQFETNFLPTPHGINFSYTFEVTKIKSFHTINVFSGQDIKTREELLRIDNWIVGQSPSQTFDASVTDWFHNAHTWLVNSFKDITTKEMHKIWEEK